jgi:tRNA(Met) C34 N-acetyltransferase TmcA
LELGDTLRDLDAGLVESMMGDDPSAGMPDEDRRLLEGFAFAKRPFEPTRPALFRLVSAAFACRCCWQGLSETERTALICRVMQARPWKEVAEATGLSGRARLLEVLRRATAGLLEAAGGATAVGGR